MKNFCLKLLAIYVNKNDQEVGGGGIMTPCSYHIEHLLVPELDINSQLLPWFYLDCGNLIMMPSSDIVAAVYIPALNQLFTVCSRKIKDCDMNFHNTKSPSVDVSNQDSLVSQ